MQSCVLNISFLVLDLDIKCAVIVYSPQLRSSHCWIETPLCDITTYKNLCSFIRFLSSVPNLVSTSPWRLIHMFSLTRKFSIYNNDSLTLSLLQSHSVHKIHNTPRSTRITELAERLNCPLPLQQLRTNRHVTSACWLNLKLIKPSDSPRSSSVLRNYLPELQWRVFTCSTLPLKQDCHKIDQTIWMKIFLRFEAVSYNSIRVSVIGITGGFIVLFIVSVTR